MGRALVFVVDESATPWPIARRDRRGFTEVNHDGFSSPPHPVGDRRSTRVYRWRLPGVRFLSAKSARVIVHALVCLANALRSQSFSLSQRFAPTRALRLCFTPHPPIGFGPSELCSTRPAAMPLGIRCSLVVGAARSKPSRPSLGGITASSRRSPWFIRRWLAWLTRLVGCTSIGWVSKTSLESHDERCTTGERRCQGPIVEHPRFVEADGAGSIASKALQLQSLAPTEQPHSPCCR